VVIILIDVFELEYLSLELHLYISVRALHCNGCHHVVGGILYFMNHCGSIVTSPLGYACILCKHKTTSNSYCLDVVELCVR
jgi:hypothetical protein